MPETLTNADVERIRVLVGTINTNEVSARWKGAPETNRWGQPLALTVFPPGTLLCLTVNWYIGEPIKAECRCSEDGFDVDILDGATEWPPKYIRQSVQVYRKTEFPLDVEYSVAVA